MCDGLATEQNTGVGKNSDPIFVCRLSHDILGHFVLSNALARLFMSCFVKKIFAIKARSHRNSEQMLNILHQPNVFGRDDPDFSTADC